MGRATRGVPAHSSARRRGFMVLVMGLAAAVMTLDVTVVNVALSAVGREFGASLSDLQWVVNAYTLAFAALLLSAGALSDRLGRRGTFLLGISLFTAASLACALAPSEGLLIAGRALQGAGGSLVMGTGLALIAGVYEGEDPRKRQTAIGIFTAMGAAAAALGPLVGGALVEGVGWRSIFLVNIPFGLVIIATTLAMVRPQPTITGARIDVAGAVLAVAMLFSLNYGLLTGASGSWSDLPVIGALVASVVLFGAFLVVERRRGSRAMLDLSLFRIPTFSGAIVLSFAARLTSFGLFPFLILWLTGVLGHTPLEVGLILLILTVAMFPGAGLSGQLTKIASVRVLMLVGMVVVGVGLVVSAFTLGPDSTWRSMVVDLVLMGLGAGIVMPHMLGLAVGVVPADRAGMASGVANSFFPLGTAVGVAAYGVLMTGAISGRVPDTEAANAVAAGRLDLITDPTVAAAGRAAFVDGLSDVLLVAGVAGILSGIAVLLLVRPEDVHVEEASAAVAAE